VCLPRPTRFRGPVEKSDEPVLIRVREVLKEVFGVNPQSVSLETKAFDIAGWDSVGHLSLCGALEEAFGMRFDATELADMTDVGKIVAIIETKSHEL
jgi:acyl carrier protein